MSMKKGWLDVEDYNAFKRMVLGMQVLNGRASCRGSTIQLEVDVPVLLKITGQHPSSRTTGYQRVFQGDVYALGLARSATITGVTIIDPTLAVDEVIPTGTSILGVPLYGYTWTSTGGDVTEWVYECVSKDWARSPVPLKITGQHPSSRTTGYQRVFQGDIYANGWGNASTSTGVTIIDPSLAVDEVIPANTTAFGTVYYGYSWTGTGGAVTETVYEVNVEKWR